MNTKNLQVQVKTNRKYKDRVFRLLYKDKKHFLELYNALNGTNYDEPEALEVTTLENAVFMGMKNDVSYVLYDELILYEHQSTPCPNIPLRDLFYVTDIYSELTKDENLFRDKLITIPAPQFVVFYNGTEEKPEQYELKLSTAYTNLTDTPSLELKVKVLNVNYGYNQKLMDNCQSLKGYAVLVKKCREYQKIYGLDEAIHQAIDECIQEGYLVDFLRKQRSEVYRMCWYEIDEERYWRDMREDAEERGMEAGMKRGMKRGMEAGIQQGIQLNCTL